MKTVAELLAQATRIGVGGGTGQAPEAEDVARMREVFPSTIGGLYARRVVDARFLIDLDETARRVPDAWFVPLARIVAFYGADDLSTAGDAQLLGSLKQVAEEELHQMAHVEDVDTPVRACYF